MTQETFDIIEIICLIIGGIFNLLTLYFLVKYTQKTYTIAKSTQKTASETAAMAKLTEESFAISANILDEMIETRDAEISPYVFVFIDQMEEENAVKLFLVIKNVGKGIAKNIKIKFEPELQNGGTYSLKHINQIINNMPPLPPGGEIRHAFALTTKYLTATPSLPKQYNVFISFIGGIKKAERTFEQVVSLDFFQGSRLNSLREKR